MGCDIHLYVERRDETGTWVSADKWTPNKYADEEGEPPFAVDYGDRFYAGRNYDLFAMLADVRNGRGFAGIVTGDGFNPISDPKGLPDDVSAQVKADSDRWEGDGHSHSHLTVAELLEYDWTQTTRHIGIVSPGQWAEFKANGKPTSWSGDISGGNVKKFSAEEFNAIWLNVAAILRAEDPEARVYDQWPHHHLRTKQFFDEETRALELFKKEAGVEMPVAVIQWSTSYYESAGNFLSKTMPKLWRLGRPEDVRIVFWFDN